MFYDPFEEIRRIHRELDRMLSEMFGRMGRAGASITIREPVVDLIDAGDHFVLVVELPGVEKEDVELYVNRDSVTIKAERRAETDRKGGSYFVRERSYSAFYRTIALPEPVVPEETRATFRNGVLEVTLKKERPEKREERGYRVKIE